MFIAISVPFTFEVAHAQTTKPSVVRNSVKNRKGISKKLFEKMFLKMVHNRLLKPQPKHFPRQRKLLLQLTLRKPDVALPTLLTLLKEGTAEQKTDALSFLTMLHKRALPAGNLLITFLGGKSDSHRDLARKALSNIGQKILPILLKSSLDKNWRVRYESIEAIADLGLLATSALPFLKKRASGEEKDVRVLVVVISTTASMGKNASSALPMFLGYMTHSNWRVRTNASWALSQIGPKIESALPALLKAMGDTEFRVRGNAAQALAVLGVKAKSGIPLLIGQLRDKAPYARFWAINALSKMGSAAIPAIPELILMEKEKFKGIREAAKKLRVQLSKLQATTAPSGKSCPPGSPLGAPTSKAVSKPTSKPMPK